MVHFHMLQLDFSYLATLPCQNAGCTHPICTKSKTVFKITKFLKVQHTIA